MTTIDADTYAILLARVARPGRGQLFDRIAKACNAAGGRA
jgi:hypothetical protein